MAFPEFRHPRGWAGGPSPGRVCVDQREKGERQRGHVSRDPDLPAHLAHAEYLVPFLDRFGPLGPPVAPDPGTDGEVSATATWDGREQLPGRPADSRTSLPLSPLRI
jgi:hypothetical protein